MASPSSIITVGIGTPYGSPSDIITLGYGVGAAGGSALILGSLVPTGTESDVQNNSNLLTITLSGDTWITLVGGFNAIRQDIINGITSSGAEASGWNAAVRDTLSVTAVTRLSDTFVSILIPAVPGYAITAPETITVTVPGSALAGGSPIVATPTFTITPGAANDEGEYIVTWVRRRGRTG